MQMPQELAPGAADCLAVPLVEQLGHAGDGSQRLSQLVGGHRRKLLEVAVGLLEGVCEGPPSRLACAQRAA
jgi:hypothetical protein